MALMLDDEMEALEAALDFVDAFAPPHTDTIAPGASNAAFPSSQRSAEHDFPELKELLLPDDTELDCLLLEALTPLHSSASDPNSDALATPAIALQSSLSQHVAPSPPLAANSNFRDATASSSTSARPRRGSTSKADTPKTADKSRRCAKANPNRARNERKHELVYLRNKVQQMETELGALHRRHQHGKESAGSFTAVLPPSTTNTLGVITFTGAGSNALSSGGSDLTMATIAVTPPVWQDMAARQRRRRNAAERENVRLKLVLEGQIKLAKSMERLLQKRAKQQVQDCAGCVHQSNRLIQGRALDILADKATYEALLAGVESAYSEMDAVFAVNGLDSMETPGRDARMREGPNGMYLDILSTKLLPFDLKSTGRAVWNHFKGSEKHRGNLYQKAAKNLEEVNDTVLEDFVMDFKGKTTSSDFRVKQIVRKYVEADREIVVTVASVISLGQSAKRPFSSLGFTEKSYVVIKRPTSLVLLQGGFSVLQMCSLVVPQQTESSVLDASTVGAFTEFVLNVIAANITMSQELIENVLLDQSVQRHRT